MCRGAGGNDVFLIISRHERYAEGLRLMVMDQKQILEREKSRQR